LASFSSGLKLDAESVTGARVMRHRQILMIRRSEARAQVERSSD
jgi:hypothetical protein